MPFIADIYFHVYQAGERTSVVLLHGAGGSHLSWSPQIRRLDGYQVLALDLPGHGKSAGRGLQTIAAYTNSITDWMQAIGLHRAIFVGHSMGGAIAQTLALESPELVTGLVLIGSATRLRVNPQLLEKTASMTTYQSAVEDIISWSFSPHCASRLTELATRRMLETRQSVLLADFLACSAFDITDRVAEISCPTLVVCGAEDKMTPTRNSQFLASHIPGAQLEIVSAAGHMVMLEQPQGVANILAQFIHQISTKTQ